MEEKVTFGRYIFQKRKKASLSQKQLAEVLFVTESAVSKWERGVSYPDISLVAPLCVALNISEHELITATDDFAQRELVRQAKSFRTLVNAYSWVFYTAYGISLISCFITNLAIEHRLSWFFIVLAAELVAFSLVNLPVLVHRHKGLVTVGSFFVSLNLLLFVCCVYSKGDWYYITFVSILFGFAVVFLPFFLRALSLGEPWRHHKALLSIGIDSVLLFILVAISCNYAGYKELIFKSAFPITAFSLILPWIIIMVIRYLKCNWLFKTAICLFASGIYVITINSVIRMMIEHKTFQIIKINLFNWAEPYINGNVTGIIALTCMFLAMFFVVGGIVLSVKQRGE